MVKVSVTYTRPSVSVPWHFEVVDMSAVTALAQDPAWANKHQGKTTADLVAPGAASTTLEAFTIWASQADAEAFTATAESQAYAAARDAYNAENGITKSEPTVTEV